MADTSFANELQELVKKNIKFKEPLARYTTWKVGGPADYLVEVSSMDELRDVVKFCKKKRKPFMVLGKGSNILVYDEGFRGVVICLKGDFNKVHFHKEKVIVGAGVSLARLIKSALGQGLGGIEGLVGIPASVGGALVNNAGGKWGCIGAVVDRVKMMTKGCNIVNRTKREMQFGYRKSNIGKDEIVCESTLLLRKEKRNVIKRKVKKYFDIKRRNQPLTTASCGCVFRNPDGMDAGYLIEKAGMKGVRVGKARVSTKHANFILNEGSAKARDILNLIKRVRQAVKKMYGINLELEIQTVGKM